MCNSVQGWLIQFYLILGFWGLFQTEVSRQLFVCKIILIFMLNLITTSFGGLFPLLCFSRVTFLYSSNRVFLFLNLLAPQRMVSWYVLFFIIYIVLTAKTPVCISRGSLSGSSYQSSLQFSPVNSTVESCSLSTGAWCHHFLHFFVSFIIMIFGVYLLYV